MGKKRRNYTEAFKREALRLWEESNKSGTQIEKELGIGSGCLYRWRQEKRAAEHRPEADLELRIAQQSSQELEHKVAVLQQEREILKKAVAIFTRPRHDATSSSKSTAGSIQ